MDKKLESFKVSKSEMNRICGGYNSTICKALEVLANEGGVQDWDEWAEAFEKNC